MHEANPDAGSAASNDSHASKSARTRLGRVGIWSMELRFGDSAQAAEAAAELDELGFGAIWIPGGVGGDVFGDVDRLLSATRRAVIATGIINIWKHKAEDIGAWWKAQSAERQARLLLGLGVSHGPLIGDAYRSPLATMRTYLAQLSEQGLPPKALCLAALGPKMLELSRDRTAGAHPYLVTPEHSAMARRILGPDALLAPEQGVVLERDPARARELCVHALEHYRRLPNYLNSWRRLGFAEDDITNASGRLIDALFAYGGTERIVERVNAHLSAGADHVCLQVITGAAGADVAAARRAWRELASALIS
ncbi:MAG: TIGR03620 family F420-dependent LLM class oxidoreductase [Rhizomicrobium sp.]